MMTHLLSASHTRQAWYISVDRRELPDTNPAHNNLRALTQDKDPWENDTPGSSPLSSPDKDSRTAMPDNNLGKYP